MTYFTLEGVSDAIWCISTKNRKAENVELGGFNQTLEGRKTPEKTSEGKPNKKYYKDALRESYKMSEGEFIA